MISHLELQSRLVKSKILPTIEKWAKIHQRIHQLEALGINSRKWFPLSHLVLHFRKERLVIRVLSLNLSLFDLTSLYGTSSSFIRLLLTVIRWAEEVGAADPAGDNETANLHLFHAWTAFNQDRKRSFLL